MKYGRSSLASWSFSIERAISSRMAFTRTLSCALVAGAIKRDKTATARIEHSVRRPLQTGWLIGVLLMAEEELAGAPAIFLSFALRFEKSKYPARMPRRAPIPIPH